MYFTTGRFFFVDFRQLPGVDGNNFNKDYIRDAPLRKGSTILKTTTLERCAEEIGPVRGPKIFKGPEGPFYQIFVTFAAFGPFSSVVISNLTLWPFVMVLNPSPWIEEK